MRDSSVVKVCAVPAEELCLVSSIHVSKLIHPGGSDSSWISGHYTQVNIALSPEQSCTHNEKMFKDVSQQKLMALLKC